MRRGAIRLRQARQPGGCGRGPGDSPCLTHGQTWAHPFDVCSGEQGVAHDFGPSVLVCGWPLRGWPAPPEARLPYPSNPIWNEIIPDSAYGSQRPRSWRCPACPVRATRRVAIDAVWLSGLTAASTAGRWLWSRWGSSASGSSACPVFLALLWGLSNEAIRLLPNVY
jgi:hypothetical protein